MTQPTIAEFKCTFCPDSPGCILHDLPEDPDARTEQLKLQDTTTIAQMEARVRVCNHKQELKKALDADT